MQFLTQPQVKCIQRGVKAMMERGNFGKPAEVAKVFDVPTATIAAAFNGTMKAMRPEGQKILEEIMGMKLSQIYETYRTHPKKTISNKPGKEVAVVQPKGKEVSVEILPSGIFQSHTIDDRGNMLTSRYAGTYSVTPSKQGDFIVKNDGPAEHVFRAGK